MSTLKETGYIAVFLIAFFIHVAAGLVFVFSLVTLPNSFISYPEPIIHTMITIVSGVVMYGFYLLLVYAFKQAKSYFK